jgi:hypothetical protein
VGVSAATKNVKKLLKVKVSVQTMEAVICARWKTVKSAHTEEASALHTEEAGGVMLMAAQKVPKQVARVILTVDESRSIVITVNDPVVIDVHIRVVFVSRTEEAVVVM